MKASDLLRKWENLTGQIKALSAIKGRVKEGITIPSLLEELTKQIQVLTDDTDRIEGELRPHMLELMRDVGLMNVPPEMKYQWESYAATREIAILIRVLTDLKESGDPIHEFLNRVRPIEDYGSDDDG